MIGIKPNPEILKTHSQKHAHSCIPSAIEYIMKEEGALKNDFFEFQDDIDNTNQKTDWIERTKKYGIEFSDDIPYGEETFSKIDSELAEKRPVYISLQNSTKNGWHMYVVVNKIDDDHYTLVTSDEGLNESIVRIGDLRKYLPTMDDTAIRTYKKLSEAWKNPGNI